MKKFYFTFLRSFLFGVAALSVSCAVLREHSATVNFIVEQAVGRYIEQSEIPLRDAKARRVILVIDELKYFVDSDQITVAQLATLALARIPSNMEPSDQRLAIGVINIASQELSRKIGEGVLTPETTVTVNGVLDAARFGALLYVRGGR